MTNRTYKLEPEYEGRASYYGKALVTAHDTDSDDGTAYDLYSYGTHVATYCDGTGLVELFPEWDYSATTVRHVKEFLAQMNPIYAGWSKSDIMRELVND